MVSCNFRNFFFTENSWNQLNCHLRCEFKSRSCKVYSIQPYVIKFVSDLRQVGGFRQVLWFPPSIKLTANITKILLKVALNTIHQPNSSNLPKNSFCSDERRAKEHKIVYFFIFTCISIIIVIWHCTDFLEWVIPASTTVWKIKSKHWEYW